MERKMEMQWFINEPSHLKLLHLHSYTHLKVLFGNNPYDNRTHCFNTALADRDLLQMIDARVKKAVLAKIDETVSNTGEIKKIQENLGRIPVDNRDDFAFGIAIGRIYNSFHYQTRRALKRNATEAEFAEFLDILAKKAGEIRQALKQQ